MRIEECSRKSLTCCETMSSPKSPASPTIEGTGLYACLAAIHSRPIEAEEARRYCRCCYVELWGRPRGNGPLALLQRFEIRRRQTHRHAFRCTKDGSLFRDSASRASISISEAGGRCNCSWDAVQKCMQTNPTALQRTALDRQAQLRCPATDGEFNRRILRKPAVWIHSAVAKKGMKLWTTTWPGWNNED